MRCRLWISMLCVVTSASMGADKPAKPEPSLVIGTWGGPYEVAQRAALFAPFEQISGISIRTSDYTGGLEIFEQPVQPDILDMLEDEAQVACRAGFLKPFNYTSLENAAITSTSQVQTPAISDDFSKSDFHKGVFAPMQCCAPDLLYVDRLR